jgi:hypothetical protein
MFPIFPTNYYSTCVMYSVCYFNDLLISTSNLSCYDKSVLEAPLGNVMSFGRLPAVLDSVCMVN